MKDRKTVLNRFTPWQFDGEVYDLERASEKGWQLVRRTKRRRMYAYNPAVRYRYAVDFQYGYDDPAYLPCFEEQGWESLGFVARGEAQRWYFFRRPYDPSLPEEAYYIYTDEASLRQMKQMYARASLTLGVLLLWLVTSVPLRYDTGVTVCALLVFLSALWVVVFNLLQRRSVKKLRPGGCNRRRLRWAALWRPV